MSIRVTCGKCGVVLKVKDDQAGTKGKCPACRGTLYVPTLEEAAQAAAAPLGATETAPAASAGDTGAIKIPPKSKSSTKVAAAPEAGGTPPVPEANGSAVKPAPAAESGAPSIPEAPRPPASSSAESTTDDLTDAADVEPAKKASEARKGKESRSKLRMPEADEDPGPAPKEEPPKAGSHAKLRMSETDADDATPPPKAPKTPPGEVNKPAAEAGPPAGDASTGGGETKKGDGDFDLDSFLMEGPKPKALPPVPEEKAGKKPAAPRGGSGRRLSMSDDETNVSGPSETLPPPNRGRGSAAESAMAALTGSGTSSTAKDLLAKASQEGRSRAAQMPADQKERFDYAGAFKQIGREYGLYILGTIVLCGVLYGSMNYMLGSGVDLPPLASVYGKVTLKGKPVAGAMVYFTPVGTKDSADGQSNVKKPRSAMAVTDAEGNYELMYMEGIEGAVVGQNRVWIDPFSPENYKKIPGNYQKAETSGDIREVKATGGEENIELAK